MDLPVASSLKTKSTLSKYIDSTTKDIIKVLSSKIINANRSGFSTLETTIPTWFNYCNTNEISNTELQLIIYNKLILFLEEKKYAVKIQSDGSSTNMIITWGTKREYDFEALKKKLNTVMK